MNLGINSGILIVVPIPKEYSASGNPNESAIQNALKEECGILIAVPIPKEYYASGNLIESAMQKALKEAWEQNIT
ncbi:pseudouridine-5 -phosphate glycosidase 2-like isoform X1 [Olea europaea subsp. europaea]|uniref:Pseudouridine-5 -phosphate glycosidase 2-like isoform X1 n=1 Tax=Olea europaea subsp. europaea TaxID=158383 RepID=A0A8S0VLM6_OLEEU|nr:pseudouridine-5 -phosphate glycosidase 2-like isoform X1 [Olea europaea subsp. europaea]